MVAEDLRRRFKATKVSFLIVDLTGKAVARLPVAGTLGGKRSGSPCSAASTSR